jgi:hypothetical protein
MGLYKQAAIRWNLPHFHMKPHQPEVNLRRSACCGQKTLLRLSLGFPG